VQIILQILPDVRRIEIGYVSWCRQVSTLPGNIFNAYRLYSSSIFNLFVFLVDLVHGLTHYLNVFIFDLKKLEEGKERDQKRWKKVYSQRCKNVVYEMWTVTRDFVGDLLSKDVAMRTYIHTCMHAYYSPLFTISFFALSTVSKSCCQKSLRRN
jgi:hypothetical protein